MPIPVGLLPVDLPLQPLMAGKLGGAGRRPTPDHGYDIHFITATNGWRLVERPPKGSEPFLRDDIEFLHSVDGGLTWQLQRGKLTDLARWGNAQVRTVLVMRRLRLTHIYFVDEQFGWIIGYTGLWIGGREIRKLHAPKTSNALLTTEENLGDARFITIVGLVYRVCRPHLRRYQTRNSSIEELAGVCRAGVGLIGLPMTV